jgi:hypothetical protein
MDYRREDKNKVQKTLIIDPEQRTVPPEDAIEDTAFKPGFEIVKF